MKRANTSTRPAARPNNATAAGPATFPRIASGAARDASDKRFDVSVWWEKVRILVTPRNDGQRGNQAGLKLLAPTILPAVLTVFPMAMLIDPNPSSDNVIEVVALANALPPRMMDIR